MRFRYRILIYAQENKLKIEETEMNKQLKLKKEDVNVNVDVDAENNVQQARSSVDREKPLSGNTKSVTFATEKTYIDAPKDEITDCNIVNNHQQINNNSNNNNNHEHYNNNDGNFNRNVEYKLKSSLKVRKSKYKIDNDYDYDEASGLPPPAVKMVIARKPALVVEPHRKTSLKRSQSDTSAQNNNHHNVNNNNKNSTIVTNDFKCLRSNDMRYSDYAVTSSTTTNQSNMAASGNKRADNNKLSKNDKTQIKLTIPATTANIKKPATAPPTVVVSIPRFPLSSSSSYDKDELFENVTLAQLKTASSKKITENKNNNAITTSINQNNNKNAAIKVENNLPRLKIELNSLKTKITLPKSSTPDFEDVELGLKTHKVRKRAYEEVEPTTEQVDLETYAKNIGLKPIDSVEKNALKYSPNASPHSSTSNSSNCSALTNFESTDLDYTVSTHKKRKKKHHSKEGNGGSKKRKLHAEISSQNADESLKMKVKITAAHSHRGHHKLAAISEEKLTETKPANTNGVVEPPAKSLENSQLAEKEEEVKTAIIPASPPLPPSLFKTVPPLTLSSEAPAAHILKIGVSNATTSVPNATVTLAKSPTPKPASPKLVMPITTTTATTTTTQPTPTPPPAAAPQPQQQQQKTFAVPTLPTRTALPTAANTTVRKFTATMPATIASAAHKQQQQQQQQVQKLQKKTLKQLEHERQVKQAMDSFSHNFKLPKLPIVKSTTSSGNSSLMPTFDNRHLYTPVASAALNDFQKRLGANTVTITSRPKVSNANKSAFQVCDLSALQRQQQNNQMKTSLDFMRAANAGKAAAMNFAAARSARVAAINGNKEECRSTTLMGPPLSTILKSPRKAPNSKISTHTLSALTFNMSPHASLTMATLAAAAGNINSTTSLPHGVRSPPLRLTTALAAAKNKSPYRQSPPALVNLSSPVNLMFPHPDMYRPIVRNNNNKTSALDLSGNSLEAALNKMKQNIMSCTVTTAERELAGTTTTTTTTTINTTPTDSAHNLQSLQSLAKEREKLATMFEKSKLLQQSPAAMVRPQNASVRNIPNPSALAFRNQPTTTAISTIKSPTTPPPPLTTTPTTTSSVSKNVALNVATSNVNTNSNNQSPPLRATKKPTTIDQVAANLNMRAAAAALSAAVTNTTSTATTAVKSQVEPGKVIKIADTTTTNGETTAISAKEEKQQEISKSAIENTTTTTTATATTTTMSKPASNLKSISENSCSSPGPTKVTSIKLEKIAVE